MILAALASLAGSGCELVLGIDEPTLGFQPEPARSDAGSGGLIAPDAAVAGGARD